MSQTTTSDGGITRAGRRFVTAWGVSLALLSLAGGCYITFLEHRNKVASAARHQARVDPKATEPGKTEAETTPPPGEEGRTPADVRVGIYVDRIVELSMKDSAWTADFYIWFNWSDDDLHPGETFQVVDGQIESRQRLEETSAGDQHYALYRATAKITKVFDTSRFPTDDHLLTINVEDTQRQSYELRFVADEENSAISSRVKTPGYRVYRTGAVVKPHSYKTTRGDPRLPAGFKSTYSQFIYGIWIARTDWGFYFKMFLALFAAVGISLLVFFIKPTDVDPRFGLGVGALFAAVANSYITSSLMPDSGILTLADLVNSVGIVMILLTIVESTISLHLYDRRGQEALSKLLDRVTLAILAVSYVAINIALPLSAAM